MRTGGLIGRLTAMTWAMYLVLPMMTPKAYAALQGERGAETSSAVTTISLNIEPNIQISNVSDITLDVTNRNEDIQFEERVCIRGNIGSRYSVTAASQDGSQNPFQLQTDTGDTIAYEVYFRGDLAQTTTDQLQPGQSSPFYSMQTQVQDCAGDDTAAFTVLFKSADLLPAAPGSYSGYLTLTVAAE